MSRRSTIGQLYGWAILCLSVMPFVETSAWADEVPGAVEGIDDIERRVQQQIEQNLTAVRTLIGRAAEQLKGQRVELQAVEKELARDRNALSVLGEVPEPLEPSTVGAAPVDDIPRPSPSSPPAKPKRVQPLPATKPGLPPLPNAGPILPKEDLPTVRARVHRLTGRVREMRQSVQKIESELLRARSLLKSLGDDSAPPQPASAAPN